MNRRDRRAKDSSVQQRKEKFQQDAVRTDVINGGGTGKGSSGG